MSSGDIPVLDFSLTLQSWPVTLTGENGPQTYAVQEMSGEHRDLYLNQVQQRLKKDAHGNAEIRDFKRMQANLIRRCLIDPEGQLVTEDQIQSFPSTVVAELFDACKKINKLDNEDAPGDDSKND
jgi:hypothetical protein